MSARPQPVSGQEARQDEVHDVVLAAPGAAGRAQDGHRPEVGQEQKVAGVHGRAERGHVAARPLDGPGSDVVHGRRWPSRRRAG